MSRPVFRSVVRTRVLERIAQACAYPIALIVAPAGYGKSVALRQYLDTLSEPYIRFDVRPEHATLPAFIRAFAESLSAVAPHMVASLPDALRGTPAADELTAWFNAQLNGYCGLIVVDDLQFAGASEVARFLCSAMQTTKDRIRWLIATRSVPDLPVATWITYGDMDLAVDERDLAFTVEEAREASSDTGAMEDEVRGFVEMTQGWATALNFALRMRLRTNELSAIGSTTRDMVYRYLAEQVYDRLSDAERDLLHFAVYLPAIDVDLLIRAGYRNSLEILEHLRTSAAFLSVEGYRRYRCHDLFRDFLQHRVRLSGEEASLQNRVADLLLIEGRISDALHIYTASRCVPKITKVLNDHGFELIDRIEHYAIDRALSVLAAETLTHDSTILALRGIREAEKGRFDRAESLLRHALRAQNDNAVQAEIALRLATVLNHQHRDVIDVLEPYWAQNLPAATKGKMASYLALAYAAQGLAEKARHAMRQAEDLQALVECEATQARMLHRVAVAKMALDAPLDEVAERFASAYRLAERNGLFVTASAASCGLAAVNLLWKDDALSYKVECERALEAARKSGDRASIRNALSQVLHAECQLGNFARAEELVKECRHVTADQRFAAAYIDVVTATIVAGRGRFEEAYSLTSGAEPHYVFDRIYRFAVRALYAVASDRREEAISLVAKSLQLSRDAACTHLHSRRRAELARILCAVVEALAGRGTAARRILRGASIASGIAVDALRSVAENLVGGKPLDALEYLGALRTAGCADLAHVLKAAVTPLTPAPEKAALTHAERNALRALESGRNPKEIAAETGRSIHTVRTLIQRATEKLGCSGRQQAIAEARRRGLLEADVRAGRSSVSA